ncbi:bifunctional helix-turn-helix transcriptional regulator/GNAT family N-acetyltransferase [Streptantibioticus parmotrematis]|uniref:bifunctional helix-turn-helix transcriptional regulator/GNAT family N-acetyltransferase n=1 Tax=Streptantibioticus parmotrematis TaxID=2873249 RepID=UPI0033FDFE74
MTAKDAPWLGPTVDAIRSFNRFYTSLIGALDYAGRLGTPYSLTEARVLYELNQQERTAVPRLRETIRAEAAHLSRVLARLEKAGLVVREEHPTDRRVHLVRPTAAGREAAALLDERSWEAVGDLVARLGEGQRRRLTEALRTAQEVLSRPRVGTVVLRGPRPGDLGWVIRANGALYAEQFGWNEEYEALVTRIVGDFASGHDPAREALWIAEFDGEPVGCVMCVRESDETARLRLLLVAPTARGNGVGDRLVSQCVCFARQAGYREIVLWTNDVLAAARKIYERHEFELVAEKPHHSFGKDLVGQDWVMTL